MQEARSATAARLCRRRAAAAREALRVAARLVDAAGAHRGQAPHTTTAALAAAALAAAALAMLQCVLHHVHATLQASMTADGCGAFRHKDASA